MAARFLLFYKPRDLSLAVHEPNYSIRVCMHVL